MNILTINLSHIEAVFGKVTFPSETIIVSSFYRPPNTNTNSFKTKVQNNALSES